MAAEEGVEPSISRFRAERLASSATPQKNLVAGVRVELTVAVFMRHTSRPCSIPASKVWRLVVDSHHSLRLFRPTLELSQLPSRVPDLWWLEPDLHRRPDVYETSALLAELSSHEGIWSGREDTYLLAPRACASLVLAG